MRGIFTAGLCDSLLDWGVTFDYVIGTSAGASNGCTYLAGQRGRSRFVNIDLHNLRPYVGLGCVMRGRGFFDLDFVFDEVQENYYPYDFVTYQQNPARMVIVMTSAVTGEAVYCEERNDFKRFSDACRASCSLPLMCPTWHVDGEPMVDGGVGDSIPFRKALADGCRHVVVVTTKEASYRKSERPFWLPSRVYKQFPRLREALLTRGRRYNEQLDDLAQLEAQGIAKVIRPKDMHGVTRTTQVVEPLEALYAEGLKAGRELAEQLNNWKKEWEAQDGGK